MQMENNQYQINDRKTVNKINMLEVKGEGMIHDVCYDYFGAKVATGSSDGKISVYDITQSTSKGEPVKKIENFEGHNGPVWQLRWSNPKYGNLLASCSFDKKIKIWKEINGKWDKIAEMIREASVNTVAWAPKKLILASGSADGEIIIYKQKGEKEWEKKAIMKHEDSVNTIDWLNSQDKFILASGSNDRKIIIWRFEWTLEKSNKLRELTFDHWVRSVNWAAESFENLQMLAIGLESSQVVISYLNDNFEEKTQKSIKTLGPCWKVSWSPLGNQLAISTINEQGMSNVIVVMQNENNEFEEI